MSTISKIQSPSVPQTGEDKKKLTEDKFHEVAELYERHFIREMMKQMRSTVHEGGFIKQNNAEKIFRDQMDDHYADQWGKSGGIGLSQIIYDQLVDKFGPQMGLKKNIEKPNGPIELNHKSQFSGLTSLQTTSSKQNDVKATPVTYKFLTSATGQSEIKNPWAGVLLDKKFLEMDQMQYRIKHDNGLESLILTRGTGLGQQQQLSQGDTIQAGESIGLAQASSPLFWTVQTNVSE